MDLAFDYVARNLQHHDTSVAARVNEHRRAAEERRTLEQRPVTGVNRGRFRFRFAQAVRFRRAAARATATATVTAPSARAPGAA